MCAFPPAKTRKICPSVLQRFNSFVQVVPEATRSIWPRPACLPPAALPNGSLEQPLTNFVSAKSNNKFFPLFSAQKNSFNSSQTTETTYKIYCKKIQRAFCQLFSLYKTGKKLLLFNYVRQDKIPTWPWWTTIQQHPSHLLETTLFSSRFRYVYASTCFCFLDGHWWLMFLE